jgi:1-deoxy-D-xylulose-5-phosphate synthase
MTGQLDRGIKIRTLCLPDVFIDHDKPEAMYARSGLDAAGIVRAATGAVGIKTASDKDTARLRG